MPLGRVAGLTARPALGVGEQESQLAERWLPATLRDELGQHIDQELSVRALRDPFERRRWPCLRI
jgi:hypothetical protein